MGDDETMIPATQSTGTSFSDEVFEYWIPRLIADGIDAIDIQRIRGIVTGWDDWPEAWARTGEDYLEFASERMADRHERTAADAYVRASLCFHFGQIVAVDRPDLKRTLQAQKVLAYRTAARLLVPPAIELRIPHEGVVLPGYLRIPEHPSPPCPCVILVPGLDSTKEDFHTLSEMLLCRKIATVTFDGTGQGEAWENSSLGEGYETCIRAVLRHIEQHPQIDSRRTALLGRSLGGFFALRAAADEPGLRACVVFGGTFDLADWDTMPASILNGFLFGTRSAGLAEARQKMGSATLADRITNVRCPTLVVHGRHDRIFSANQAERITYSLGDLATLLMDEDGVHCCHNHAFQYRNMMADWLTRHLQGEQMDQDSQESGVETRAE